MRRRDLRLPAAAAEQSRSSRPAYRRPRARVLIRGRRVYWPHQRRSDLWCQQARALPCLAGGSDLAVLRQAARGDNGARRLLRLRYWPAAHCDDRGVSRRDGPGKRDESEHLTAPSGSIRAGQFHDGLRRAADHRPKNATENRRGRRSVSASGQTYAQSRTGSQSAGPLGVTLTGNVKGRR